jgi:hypothetical protein
MLRFVRLQRPLTGLAITYGTLVVTRWFAFRGMVPLPRILCFIFALVSSFAALTPYLLDRLFAVRIKGIANSLVFLATWVTIAGIAQIALFRLIRPPYSSLFDSPSSFGVVPKNHTAPRPCRRGAIMPSLFK